MLPGLLICFSSNLALSGGSIDFAQFIVDLEALTLCLDGLINLIAPEPGLTFPLMTFCLTTNRLSSTVGIALESLSDFLSRLSLRINAFITTLLIKLSLEICRTDRIPELPSTKPSGKFALGLRWDVYIEGADEEPMLGHALLIWYDLDILE